MSYAEKNFIFREKSLANPGDFVYILCRISDDGKKREGFVMKKSDIAIYVSAILTLVLTTFVVFSTQKVTYENKADEVLKNNNLATNQFAMATDPDTSSDANSPLFRNRIPDSDTKEGASDQISETGTKAADIRDTVDNDDKVSDSAPVVQTRTKSPAAKKADEPKSVSVADRSAADSSFADTTVPRHATRKSDTRSELFDDEAPAATVKASAPKTTRPVVDAPARTVPEKTVQTGSSRSHTVQYGEMLRSIAARHGTTTLKLIQINNISNPDLIYPGQVIRLP